jgi:hypothetical protein
MNQPQQPDLNSSFNPEAFQILLNQWRSSKDKKERLSKIAPSSSQAVVQ